MDSLWNHRLIKFFSRQDQRRSAATPDVSAPSSVLSLEASHAAARMLFASNASFIPFSAFTIGGADNVNVHRFAENINGRDYLIEVSSVGADKWRAQIARVPGGSAALMPFYGKTPDEAAGQLSRWLAIAHGVKQR